VIYVSGVLLLLRSLSALSQPTLTTLPRCSARRYARDDGTSSSGSPFGSLPHSLGFLSLYLSSSYTPALWVLWS
jgi:hypothetical protein